MNAPYWCIRVIDGKHVPGYTTDGRDWFPTPARYDFPKAAVAYCDIRQANVQPLRQPEPASL